MRARRLAALASVAAVSTLALAAASPADERIARAERVVVASSEGLEAIDPATGRRAKLAGSHRGDLEPARSPDGTAVVAVRDRAGSSELIRLSTITGKATWITANPRSIDRAPAWSPDGRELAWSSGPPSAGDLYRMNANGDHKRALVRTPADEIDPAWSPDGLRVVYAANAGSGYDLWLLDLTSATTRQLTSLSGDELRPAWSPDGTTIAFTHAETTASLMTIPAAGGTPVTILSPVLGRAAWSPDSTQLAVPTETGIVVLRPDGSGAAQLRGSRPSDRDPTWGTIARATGAPVRTGAPPRPGELLPDLEQRAPSDLVVMRSGSRWLLGFTSMVDNLGSGPLWIRGRRPSTKVHAMRANQLVELRNGKVRAYENVGRLHYERHAPHFHWHLQLFERAELRRAADFRLLVRDRKIGFCLADHYGTAARRALRPSGPRFLGNCGAGEPNLLHVDQGASPGFTDRYPAFFHGQNVDITRVPAGIYVLVHRANPTLSLHELEYGNNAASVRIRLRRHGGEAPSVQVLRVCEGGERCPPREHAGK